MFLVTKKSITKKEQNKNFLLSSHEQKNYMQNFFVFFL